MVATMSVSVGQKIQQGIERAIETIDQYRCYHRDFGSQARLHFNIKMHSWKLPEQVQQMLDDGYLDDETVYQHQYDSWAHEFECFVEGLDTANTVDGAYYVDGEPYPVEVWFSTSLNRKHQDVYQCGRSGGYLNVPMPPAYLDWNNGYQDWESIRNLMLAAVQVERFATLVEYVRKLVDDGYSDPDGGTFYLLIEDEYPKYLAWKEERDTPDVDDDDHY